MVEKLNKKNLKEIANLIVTMHNLINFYKNYSITGYVDDAMNLKRIQKYEEIVITSYQKLRDINIIEKEYFKVCLVGKEFYKSFGKYGIKPKVEYWK